MYSDFDKWARKRASSAHNAKRAPYEKHVKYSELQLVRDLNYDSINISPRNLSD